MLSWLFAASVAMRSNPEAVGLPPLSDTVVYEENLRAEGPNVGFKALTSRLDSIRALGANVLWLMPVQPVGKLKSAGGLGSPYAMADFTGVNPEFGSVADFKALIAQAHRRKMAVIIDWVANHSSWDNPWISAHNDWYQHDANGRVISPPNTNWKDVAQLDFKNSAMRSAMVAAMQSWVDRFGIDGFRCDSAEFVPDDFWKQAVNTLRAHSEHRLLMLAEGYRPSLCDAGFDFAYGWHFCDRLVEIVRGRKASDLARSVAEEAQSMPAGAKRLRFITNHDKYAWDGTPMEMYKSAAAIKIGFALEALYGGVPLIYSGQEVNWPSRIPIFDHTTIDWAGSPDMRAWIGQIMRLRHAHAVLREVPLKDFSTEDAVILSSELGGEESLVIANVRGWPVSGTLPSSLSGAWTYALTKTQTLNLHSYRLPPYGLQILLRKSGVSGQNGDPSSLTSSRPLRN